MEDRRAARARGERDQRETDDGGAERRRHRREREPAPRERARLLEMHGERQEPERDERERDEDRERCLARCAPRRRREHDRTRDDRERRRHVRRMQEDDGGDQHDGGAREAVIALEPRREREREHGQQRPREPRAHHADAHTAFDTTRAAARWIAGERQHGHRAGQRQPRRVRMLAEDPPQQQECRHARGQIGDPDERLIARVRGERAGAHPRERGRDVEPSRRIELQLRVAGPPAVVPRPRRGAFAQHVRKSRELTGMIVERERPRAERARRERDAVGEQEEGREPRH